MSFPALKMDHVVPCAASVLVSMQAGALLFGSMVEVPTITRLDDQTLRKLFPVWWPYGAKLMIPLVSVSAVACAGAYAVTKDRDWIAVTALAFANLPYTKVIMADDIMNCLSPEKLSEDELKQTAARFGAKHHVRTLICTAAAILGIVVLTKKS